MILASIVFAIPYQTKRGNYGYQNFIDNAYCSSTDWMWF